MAGKLEQVTVYTLSTRMICNRCPMSVRFTGSLDLPQTNLRKRILSALVKHSIVSHNHWISRWPSSISLYLRTGSEKCV